MYTIKKLNSISDVIYDYLPKDQYEVSSHVEDCDAFSFHSYWRPAVTEHLVAGLRAMMRGHRNADLPLWITECGRPWKRGIARPLLSDDWQSAMEIVMKGVEARACGVACYFPFVYPYYEEVGTDGNFGMMDRDAMPLRSMAAYVFCASRLAGMDYLGDLSGMPAGLVKARVFADRARQNAVVVLYTDRADTVVLPDLGVTITKAQAMDGSPMEGGGGNLTVIGGMAYLQCPLTAISDRLDTTVLAAKLWKQAKAHVPQPRQAKPVVFRFDSSAWKHLNLGYWVDTPNRVELLVDAFNLSAEPLDVAPVLELPKGARLLSGPTGPVRVGAKAVQPLRFAVDLTACLSSDACLVRIDLADRNGQATGISLPLLNRAYKQPTVNIPRLPAGTVMPKSVNAALAATGWIDVSGRDRWNWEGWGKHDGQPAADQRQSADLLDAENAPGPGFGEGQGLFSAAYRRRHVERRFRPSGLSKPSKRPDQARILRTHCRADARRADAMPDRTGNADPIRGHERIHAGSGATR